MAPVLKLKKSNFICCLLLTALVVDHISSVSGRSVKLSRGRGRDKPSKRDVGYDLGGDETDIISLIERSDTEHGDGENVKFRKRVIRSPLDEDIDDVEDSDEDDDEEEGEDNDKAKKEKTTETEKTTSPSPSPSTSPVQQQVLKPSTNLPIPTRALSGQAENTARPPTTSTVIRGSPPKIPSNGTFVTKGTNGTTRALPPGFKPPPGAIVFAGKPPPPGAHPFPPKLPPNLLANLPKPKPPPKKGELYLPDDYNNLVIPKLNLGKLIGIDSYTAVPVLVFLNIRSVRDIDEEMETLTLDLDLVIEWVDGFLFDPISAITTRQSDITLNPIFLKKIWRPDIYIDEIVKVKRTSLMNKPLKLKFNPSNGFISYTTRLTVQLNCDMIYKYYPADTHHCDFTFRSYSYFSKDLDLSWLGSGVYLQDPQDPNFDLKVESISNLKLPQTFRNLTNDTYDGLRFTILARRKLSFHMVQTYLPSIFFIVITWLCFLVPARMVEARIGISMTTLLTLTSMFASVRESTPIVSYVKAIDIWMVFCIFFVFTTLLEFAILVWLRSRREDAEEQKLDQQRQLQEKRKEKDGNIENPTFTRSSSLESVQLRKYEAVAEFTEKYAFVIFSIIFTIFNIIYWSWLLTASDYFNWTINATLNAPLEDDD